MHFVLQSCLLTLLYCPGGGPTDLPSPWGGDMKTESSAPSGDAAGAVLVSPVPLWWHHFGRASAAACFTPRSRRARLRALLPLDALGEEGGTGEKCPSPTQDKVFTRDLNVTKRINKSETQPAGGTRRGSSPAARGHRQPAVSPLSVPYSPGSSLLTRSITSDAGCTGSYSANRWHRFSESVWFLATNPKILGKRRGRCL